MEPKQMIAAYLSPTIYPMPNSAALVLMLNTNLALSAMVVPNSQQREVKFSFHAPKAATAKSNKPPTIPATSKGLACEPLRSPDIRTWVEAVASGKGYLPCISFTKYLRKGIKNKMPKIPPSTDDRNTCRKLTVSSGYLCCKMYSAGRVNMAPATIMPEQAPILWIMMFSPSGSLRCVAPLTPTAMMVIGMAASKTCPTLRPKYAVAAENITAMSSPHTIDHGVTSRYCLLGFMRGSYSSPSFSGRNALSGSDTSSFMCYGCDMVLLHCFTTRPRGSSWE